MHSYTMITRTKLDKKHCHHSCLTGMMETQLSSLILQATAVVTAVTVGGVALFEQVLLVDLFCAIKIRCGLHLRQRGGDFSSFKNSQQGLCLRHLLSIMEKNDWLKAFDRTSRKSRQAGLFEEVLEDFIVRDDSRIKYNADRLMVVFFIVKCRCWFPSTSVTYDNFFHAV